MASKKIAVICDGREISYGLNLLHIFQYKNDKDTIVSENSQDVEIEMYSVSAFKHASIGKKTVKIFINDVKKIDSSFRKVFDDFGMIIYESEAEYILKADDSVISASNYDAFLNFANNKFKEYLLLEKQYIERVNQFDAKWIVTQFNKEHTGGLFSKSNVKKQQQFDCLSYILYLEYLLNK